VSRGDALERLTKLVEPADDDDVRASTFVRGLVVGALVGAAVAGSTIWQRRQARSAKRPVAPEPIASASVEPPAD
jgi:hypothetical protein